MRRKVLRASTRRRITVIHSGLPKRFSYGMKPPWKRCARATASAPVRASVGTIEPRKNLDTLLDAFAGLPLSLREEYELVVAGPAGWAAAGTKARLERVRYLGYVAEADLAPLTAAATVFAYPSLYEGFGFPVAQAMASGVPVITSNLSALPEVAGDAALLVDPLSIAELRNALSRLLLSPGLGAEMGARGRLRAERFRWQECAAKSLSFFRKVTGEE